MPLNRNCGIITPFANSVNDKVDFIRCTNDDTKFFKIELFDSS